MNEAAYYLERRCNEEREHIMRSFVACGARLFMDGDKWCCLYGDNIQVGICGFGTTPMEAVTNFYHAFTLKPT